MINKPVKYADKILYVGAGLHIKSTTHFPETKTFVFVDSQPRSEFDSFYPKFHKMFYKSDFVNNLIEKCKSYGFILESCEILDTDYYKKIINKKWYYTSWFYKIPQYINPTLLVFVNKNTLQKINYYVSCNVRFNMNKQIQYDIATSDGIIVAGYHPESDILQYFVKPKVFFGYNTTYFGYDPDAPKNENNTIIYFLHNCICNTKYYFSDFYMVSDDSGVITKYNSFNNLFRYSQEYISEQQLYENYTELDKTII
jgi:hypothetical protein